MTLDKKTKKGFVIVAVVVAFLTFAFCGFCYGADVCFTEESTKKLVVELEVCQNIKGQVEIIKQQIIEGDKQTTLLREKVSLYENQLTECNKNIDQWKKVADEQKKICDEQKPKLMDQALKALGFLGFGIILGLIL